MEARARASLHLADCAARGALEAGDAGRLGWNPAALQSRIRRHRLLPRSRAYRLAGFLWGWSRLVAGVLSANLGVAPVHGAHGSATDGVTPRARSTRIHACR